MAGFEESDLYAAFGLEQPAGGNEPGAAEPGAQEGQARGTEPGTGEAQEPAQTQEQDPSRDQGDGGAQGGAGGARDVSGASQAEGGQEGEPAQQTKEQPPQGGRGIRNEAEPQTAAQRAENAARRRREEQQAAIDAAVKFQSTLPVRGATGPAPSKRVPGKISIHAPRKGSDSCGGCPFRSRRDFNPRSP